jgi:hypothetical protein
MLFFFGPFLVSNSKYFQLHSYQPRLGEEITRHEMYVTHNIGARSRNRYCPGKAISITYFECVFLALGIQHKKRMHFLYCLLWPVCAYHNFSHYIINGKIFGKKLLFIKYVF